MTRILVVDDDRAVREVAVEILRRSGYRPHGVPSALHALDLLEDEPFDLVVSDVTMPDMTGVEFLFTLRDRKPDLPIVLMTGGSEHPEQTTRAAEVGASGLLYKPFSHEELQAVVADALEP